MRNCMVTAGTAVARRLTLLGLLAGLLATGWRPGAAQQAPTRVALPLIQTQPALALDNEQVACQHNYLWSGNKYGYADVRNLSAEPVFDVTVEMTFYTSTTGLTRVVTGMVPLYGVPPGGSAMIGIDSDLGCYAWGWGATAVRVRILSWTSQRGGSSGAETLAPLTATVVGWAYIWHLYDVTIEVANPGPLPAKEWRIAMRDGFGVRIFPYQQPLAPGERRRITLSSSHPEPPALQAQGVADRP